jgi:hypothetical protein
MMVSIDVVIDVLVCVAGVLLCGAIAWSRLARKG